jgi:hypothetical protein
MLSARLIHLIETHEEKIGAHILRQIRHDPTLSHLAALPEADLRQRCREILQHLGEWLLGQEEEIERRYEGIGKLRYQDSVPLNESIRGLCLIKYAMMDFIHERGFEPDYMELYVEGELQSRVEKFFDLLVIHLARGYEHEWHNTMVAAA